MSASSSLLAFDYHHYSQLMVPALQQFLKTGIAAQDLQKVWDSLYQKHRHIESGIPQQYQKQLKNSDILTQLHQGLQLDFASVCTRLDSELGFKHDGLLDLLQGQSGSSGGCGETDCPLRDTCPFNYLPPHKAYSLMSMQLFQAVIKNSCVETVPECVLGKNFQLSDLIWWYGNEVGLEYDEQFFTESNDELSLLLARLCKRGCIWGWADGGYGEGLLGWLNPTECLSLIDLLAAYDLSPGAEIPMQILDSYLIDEVIPEMRAKLLQVQNFAAESAAQGYGLLLWRE